VTSAAGSEIAGTGPFEASVRVGGEEIRGSLADFSLDVLKRSGPVRSPGVCQRQRHMPGHWFSSTARRFLEYESLLERDWMLLLDFDREVEWICEQPLRLRYSKDDKPASHVPDLLVWRAGTPELCDVKSVERLEDPEFVAQVRATGLACAEAGILGALPGVLGSMMALEVIREIVGFGEGLIGRLLMVDARSMRFETLSYAWDPDNPLSGDKPTIKDLSGKY